MPHTNPLEKSHIQNLVVNGYDFHCSRYCVLTIRQVEAARGFLRTLLSQGWIVSADNSRAAAQQLQAQQRCPVGIGFSFRGLQQLQLPTPYLRLLQDRAPAFAEGAPQRAAHRLADAGPSAAELWEPAFKPDAAHIFLTLHADTRAELDHCLAQLQQLSADAFAPEGWQNPFDGAHLAHNRRARRVHFGFVDGITNPTIRDVHRRAPYNPAISIPAKPHAAGEFLLGHPNDEEYNRWLIPSEPSVVRQFFANSSFSAFRKMAQDSAAFEKFVATAADGAPSEEYIRAKLLGRWDDGQVITAAAPDQHTRSRESLTNTELNDFDFKADPQGLGCPFGAHIRRMNPREDPVVPFRKRPLIRRGIPYGPAFTPAAADAERGLLGLFFCASLEDQFEHLLSEWGNKNPFGVPNHSTAKDPLIGNHEGGGGMFEVPRTNQAPLQLKGFSPFVTTRGTLYTLFPSLPAIGMLAGSN